MNLFQIPRPPSKIKIVDIYSGNSVKYDSLAAEGYTGVIGKGGQGEWPDMPRVKPDWTRQAEAAGLLWGIYWLVDARYKPSFQVEALKKATNMNWGGLGLWGDVEKPVLSMREREYNRLPYAGWRGIHDWMLAVQKIGASAFQDHLPGVYTSPGAYNLIMKNAPTSVQEFFGRAPLWTAQYYWLFQLGVSQPGKYGPWTEQTLHWWQVREGPDVNYWMQDDSVYHATYPLPTMPPVLNQIEDGVRWAVVTNAAAHGLYVREGPGKTYRIVDEPYYPNDQVPVIEIAMPQGEKGDIWVKIASERWSAMRYSGIEYMKWRTK